MGKDSAEERERKPNRRRTRPQQGTADWATADGAILIRAICAASIVGGALRFGYSRDGGAYAIGVYGDGEPYTDFVSSKEDINETLEYYVELFGDEIPAEQTQNAAEEAKKRGTTQRNK